MRNVPAADTKNTEHGMKILVTGGRGQLGLSLSKISEEYPGHTFVFTDMPEGDITDRRGIGRLIASEKVDAVINCAAYTAVEKAEGDRETARLVNAEGARNVAFAAFENGIPMVHISTDYVFPGTGDVPLKETDVTGPVSVYGGTKLEGERLVEATGCRAAVIRTAWLYSEFGNNFVKTMLRLGRERGVVRVVCDQRGTPTYATDLAHAAVKVLENGVDGFSLYHYTDSGQASWYDFAVEIFRTAGMDVSVEPVGSDVFPSAVRRPAYSVLSKEKIKAAGVRVPDWKASLAECIGILKKEGY